MRELFIVLVAGSWTETTPQDFMDGWYDPLLYISRRLKVEGADPADSGAVEFYARFDANRDGYYDLVSADGDGPCIRLFWGSSTGYSNSNVQLIPAASGGGCDMADLNLDGWPELIHSGNNENACKIFWGSESAGGPDPTDVTALPAQVSEAVFTYDIDKDPYLDIIVSDAWTGLLRVYWGGPGGYNPADSSIRDDLKPHCHNTEVADLNKDGYPDIILPRRLGAIRGITILWGDADRDLSNNQVWFYEESGGMPHGLTLADFNRDGWLDIAVSSCATATETAVYFSNQGSFSPGSRVILHPGVAYGGSAAWDFNEDGWLDLLVYRGEWNGNSLLPLVLYLNAGAPPYFREQDTVSFGVSANYTGGFIYDFNGDSKTDIFANALGASSYVYWGVQANGTYDSIQALSVNRDHHGGFRECGNVYDRSPTAWYESGVFSEPDPQAEATVSWIGWDSVQIGSELRMYIRTRWDGSSPWSDWREVTNGETVSEAPYFPARDIQYRAEFYWRNPAWLPWLERVGLRTSPLSAKETASGYSDRLMFGSGKGFIWVSWPGKDGTVFLYSTDGRRIGSRELREGRAEFRGLVPGVYYLVVKTSKACFERAITTR